MFLALASQAMAALLVADLVDKLEVDRLTAGKNPAVGDAVERLAVEVAAILHQAANQA